MRSKYVKIICLIFIVCTIFSGCSLLDFFAAESLIRPPKLTGENAALQQAFENAVGKDIRLFTPVSGSHRASYIFFDANSDSVDEAVVFYSLNTNSSVVHMHLLSQRDGEWYSVFDITGSGTEVYKVDFYNIDSQKNLEIAVIWSVEDSKREKTLSVYRISSLSENEQNALVSMATIQISDYVYFDVDDDNINEILYMYYNSSEKAYSLSARLLDYAADESVFVPLSDVSFNSDVVSISDILFEKLENSIRVYLECISPENKLFTELLIFDKEKEALFIPHPETTDLSELSLRSFFINSSDFNDDGIVDIPVMIENEASYVLTDDSSGTDAPLFVEWIYYSEDRFESAGKYFINETDSFALKFDTLIEDYFVVYDSINKVTQIRSKNEDDENNIIFSITAKEIDNSYGLIIGEGFLGNKNNREYSIVVTALGENLDITSTYVESLIINL